MPQEWTCNDVRLVDHILASEFVYDSLDVMPKTTVKEELYTLVNLTPKYLTNNKDCTRSIVLLKLTN